MTTISTSSEELARTDNRASVPRAATQRAYSLRLRTSDPNDTSWREALWNTHDAVNKGAKAFGDWLLTLRGGLGHELAEPPAPSRKRSDEEPAVLRKQRRILLALSWLSVEDSRGAPNGTVRIATGADSDSIRRERVLTAFRAILRDRAMDDSQIASWVDDCKDAVAARVRGDAVWVNRSAMFDAARRTLGESLTREEVWDLLEPFFGSREAYLAPVVADEDRDSANEEKAKDLVQKAGQWLSSRFGTGKGADFGRLREVYSQVAQWATRGLMFESPAEAFRDLSTALAPFGPRSDDADGILGLMSGPGYKSATRNLVKAMRGAGAVTRESLTRLAEVSEADARKCEENIGGKGRRPWSDSVLCGAERLCGFTYLQAGGPARHSEFAVMLDHAARRVSIVHSWIKRAEAERRRFEQDAKRVHHVPPTARAWLDRFVRNRSEITGASAAGGEYRIRRRAIDGWDEVVKRWSRPGCTTPNDRIATAREAQSEADEDFGDIQLFEALAADDAQCVWRPDGKPDPEALKDYVVAHDARDKQRRFKVPAYRHPDPLRHPVFCDFGNSRWDITYAVHEAAKVRRLEKRVSRDDAEWLSDTRGLRMGLWDGTRLREVSLRWASKRLAKDLALKDLALDAVGATTPTRDVARADRLGMAASGLKSGETPSPAGLFALDDWNGRLQAPRGQLNRIAKLVDRGNPLKAESLQRRVDWLVTFSAKLECRGPWFEYVRDQADKAPFRKLVKSGPRKGRTFESPDGWPHSIPNEAREGHSRLILSWLPGLRVLSVDLGHRFAAACAVWEALSAPAFTRAIEGRRIAAGGRSIHDLCVHTAHIDEHGKSRTTVYRRIGADFLSDGSRHPAPWARLDRQFLIKLQGEEAPTRKASTEERSAVARLESELGYVRSADHTLPWRIDRLMSESVRTTRLALRRLGDAARIAHALDPKSKRHTPSGGSCEHTPETRRDAVLDALMRWHDLAHGDRWTNEWAARAWAEHITPNLSGGLPTLSDEADRWERKRHSEKLESVLSGPADRFARDGARHLSELWTQRWEAENAKWPARLKWLRNWLLPRGLRPRRDDTADRARLRRARRGAARNVGGLSLTRIATIREIYQIQKAYHYKPEPANLRAGAEKSESDSSADRKFGDRALQAMERMREQRVKHIASRIVEAALGIGRIEARALAAGAPRPTARVDEVCHAVVIESLRKYRPDELQTRRENRTLMNWSSGKIRKYLEESCQLHGLHLREVMPNYTSRQCSRTGLPGIRCEDVPVTEFLTAPWWRKAVTRAREKGDAESALLVGLFEHWSGIPEKEREGMTVRVPRSGGDLFVAAPPSGSLAPGFSDARALQADLNAAANIGLRALLDPDFPGRWWYVPCDSATGKPAKDRCAGAACLDLETSLLKAESTSGDEKPRGKARIREKTNAWHDVGSDGGWRTHNPYWNDVKARVVAVLRRHNGL